MNSKRVSIVICTYNRAPFLLRTLESLTNLDYKNFEVVVVNGPSTDETEEILDKYKNAVKVRNNPFTNLSISRNIGIRASTGDIIAFIDDDAIPDSKWLNDLLSLYTDETIGGVGGKVYGPGGDHFQFTNGIIDVWGEAIALRDKPGDFNNPNGEFFNIMMGTNSSFSRKALMEVGGFDEYYEYFHDESDLAVRVIKAGYKVLHHPEAYIHHEFARSHIRTNIYKLNWYPIVKNTVYFGLKNSEGFGSLETRKEKVYKVAKKRLDEFKSWQRKGLITKEDYIEFEGMWERGYQTGLKDGVNSERKLNFELQPDSEFLLYNPSKVELNQQKLNICLLSQDFPPDEIGGIAKYTWQLAKGYVARGHSVHIITKGNEKNSWMQNSVNIHTVPEIQLKEVEELQHFPITRKNVQYSYAIYKRLLELDKQYNIDIIETPVWDYEGIIAARLLNIPVVTRLETPLLKAVETQNWERTQDIDLSADFEKALINLSAGIISISDNIKTTISNMYSVDFSSKNIRTIYLGVEKPEINNMDIKKTNNDVNILFVGRLERRKGIHVLLKVIPHILKEFPNVRFTFVGDDSVPNENGKTYKREFRELNKGKNFLDRVEFKGKVDVAQLNKYYQECDIFVAPSLYESFGLVFLEAMRYGKPVIGCRVGGMQEIIQDGATGFLVEAGNEQDLYEKIKELVENSDTRVEMGNKGLERFNNFFTLEHMIDNTLEFYKELLRK